MEQLVIWTMRILYLMFMVFVNFFISIWWGGYHLDFPLVFYARRKAQRGQ